MTYSDANVSCPNCGDVLVPISTLNVAMGDRFWWSTNCPLCGTLVYNRTTDGGVIGDLVANGAKVFDAGIAEEAAEWLAAQVAH